jgi:hypothetical protein
MGPDVVHGELFFLRQKVEGVRIDPHLRQEGFVEIERFLAADDIIDLPIDLQRLPICRSIVIVVLDLHGGFPPGLDGIHP